MLKQGHELVRVAVDTITHSEAVGTYSKLYLTNRTPLLVSHQLSDVLEKPPAPCAFTARMSRRSTASAAWQTGNSSSLTRLEAALCLLSQDDAQLLTHLYQDRLPLRTLAHQRSLSESAVKMRLLRPERGCARHTGSRRSHLAQPPTGQMPWLPGLPPPPTTYPAQGAGDAGT